MVSYKTPSYEPTEAAEFLASANLAVDIYCIILTPKLYTCQLHSY